MRPGGSRIPAKRVHEDGMELLKSALLTRSSIEAAVERHDGIVVWCKAKTLCGVQHVLAEVARSGCSPGQGDGDVQAGIVALKNLCRPDLVTDGGEVLVLRLLQVKVDRFESVFIDDRLIGCGGCLW